MKTSSRSKEKNTGYRSWMILFLSVAILLSGCTRILNRHFADTIPLAEGEISLAGLKTPITIRRDDMGIPFIEAETMEDLAFAIGYANAADRLNQMIGLKLVSQGRLAELAGKPASDMDIYMRTLNLVKAARILYEEISEENKALLGHYSNGVNAYMDRYRDALPPGLQLSAYVPEAWEPIDSMSIFFLVNLALSFNLQEEINILNIAQTIGPEKTAWLVPVYPDENVPLKEADKLSDVDLKQAALSLAGVIRAQNALDDMGMISIAASNNWAISAQRTEKGASILANDTHLMLSLPSLWHMMHIRCNDLEAAGVGIPGVPCVVAGYNGHIAWGMTMVMADNQDIFLEQLKEIDGEIHYLYKGKWLPAVKREEIFRIRGEKPQKITVYETAHGPLLNDALNKNPISPMQPHAAGLPYGIALSWAAFEPGDRSIDAFFNLSKTRSVKEALIYAKQIQAISLNMVLADHDNIAWQVTGRYPVRKKGRGLMPSPGWNGDYDWIGFLDTNEHPCSLNPSEGFIGTANHRSVPADFPHVLSSSWYWPERAERIAEMITSTEGHTLETSMAMQRDIYSGYASKLQKTLLAGDLYQAIEEEIQTWENRARQEKAHEAIDMLARFDCTMSTDSKDAPIISALLHTVAHNAFSDEVGEPGSSVWTSLVINLNHSYCAASDHLVVRGDESPLWDNAATPGKETKAQILAQSFADSIDLLEKYLGKDRAGWTWGKLHTYYFETEASKMAPHMGFIQRTGMTFLSPFFNRGPFPAGGDHTTLNVSSYAMARDFDTWLIPAMRIIVDFSLEEPFYAINSTGQTDNPVSPHYDDTIHEWLQGRYHSMPFKQENIEQHYTRVMVLKPSE